MKQSHSILDLVRHGSRRAMVETTEDDEDVEWPTTADGYDVLEECGHGFSATVFRARCRTNGRTVAVKKIDLENAPMKLDEIVKEAQAMRNAQHDNILTLHTSFVHEKDLWMIEPFVSGGSVLHLMKVPAHEKGLDERSIAAIMREVLKGLEYMHRNNLIHRDIKAGNILLDADTGAVKLADFGVVATLERRGSWGHDLGGRQTMCGTPCWMAPEVLLAEQGASVAYKSAADIWSVGITLFEMAHGHAPFSKLAPMHVFMRIIRDEPPNLESGDDGDTKKSFSKGFKDVVAQCLHKDPAERPTAKQLLEHRFFKAAPDARGVVKALFAHVDPLWKRVQDQKSKVQGRSVAPAAVVESSRQTQVKRGVSGWDFDLSGIKAEAAKMEAIGEDGFNDFPQEPSRATPSPGPKLGHAASDTGTRAGLEAPSTGTALVREKSEQLGAERGREMSRAVTQPLLAAMHAPEGVPGGPGLARASLQVDPPGRAVRAGPVTERPPLPPAAPHLRSVSHDEARPAALAAAGAGVGVGVGPVHPTWLEESLGGSATVPASVGMPESMGTLPSIPSGVPVVSESAAANAAAGRVASHRAGLTALTVPNASGASPPGPSAGANAGAGAGPPQAQGQVVGSAPVRAWAPEEGATTPGRATPEGSTPVGETPPRSEAGSRRASIAGGLEGGKPCPLPAAEGEGDHGPPTPTAPSTRTKRLGRFVVLDSEATSQDALPTPSSLPTPSFPAAPPAGAPFPPSHPAPPTPAGAPQQPQPQPQAQAQAPPPAHRPSDGHPLSRLSHMTSQQPPSTASSASSAAPTPTPTHTASAPVTPTTAPAPAPVPLQGPAPLAAPLPPAHPTGTGRPPLAQTPPAQAPPSLDGDAMGTPPRGAREADRRKKERKRFAVVQDEGDGRQARSVQGGPPSDVGMVRSYSVAEMSRGAALPSAALRQASGVSQPEVSGGTQGQPGPSPLVASAAGGRGAGGAAVAGAYASGVAEAAERLFPVLEDMALQVAGLQRSLQHVMQQVLEMARTGHLMRPMHPAHAGGKAPQSTAGFVSQESSRPASPPLLAPASSLPHNLVMANPANPSAAAQLPLAPQAVAAAAAAAATAPPHGPASGPIPSRDGAAAGPVAASDQGAPHPHAHPHPPHPLPAHVHVTSADGSGGESVAGSEAHEAANGDRLAHRSAPVYANVPAQGQGGMRRPVDVKQGPSPHAGHAPHVNHP